MSTEASVHVHTSAFGGPHCPGRPQWARGWGGSERLGTVQRGRCPSLAGSCWPLAEATCSHQPLELVLAALLVGAVGSPSPKKWAAGSACAEATGALPPVLPCWTPASPGLGLGSHLTCHGSGPALASASALAFGTAQRRGGGSPPPPGHRAAGRGGGGAFADRGPVLSPTLACPLRQHALSTAHTRRGPLSRAGPLPSPRLLEGPPGLRASRPGQCRDPDLAFTDGLSRGWAGSCPTPRESRCLTVLATPAL